MGGPPGASVGLARWSSSFGPMTVKGRGLPPLGWGSRWSQLRRWKSAGEACELGLGTLASESEKRRGVWLITSCLLGRTRLTVLNIIKNMRHPAPVCDALGRRDALEFSGARAVRRVFPGSAVVLRGCLMPMMVISGVHQLKCQLICSRVHLPAEPGPVATRSGAQ